MGSYQGMTYPFSINVEVAIGGFNIDNKAAQKAISDAKASHARRWQTKRKAHTESKSNFFQMYVMVEMSGMLLWQMSFFFARWLQRISRILAVLN